MKSTEEIVEDLNSKLTTIDEKEAKSVDESNDNVYSPKDDDERKAFSLGWKPTGKKAAKQWLEDYPLLKEIKQLDRQNKELAKLLQTYIDEQNNEKHNQRTAEIKKIRTEAIKMGDVELVDKIDKTLEESRPVSKPKVDQVFIDFAEKYPQIFEPSSLDDLEIREYFLKKDAVLGKHLPPDKHMRLLEEAILQKFPKLSGKDIEDDDSDEDNNSRRLTSTVESGIQSNVKKPLRKRYTEHDLSTEQLETFKGFKKYNVNISLEKYIEMLQKQGDLK